MRKWFLAVSLVLLGALAFAACGGDNGNANTESASDGDDRLVNSEDVASGGTAYALSIRFDPDSYGMTDADEVISLLSDYDSGMEFTSEDSLPPGLYASLVTEIDDFCDVIRSQFDEAVGSVSDLTCGPQREPGEVDNDDLAPGDLTDAACDPVPLRSDCGIDPDVCNQVHNIDACTGQTDGGSGVSVSPVCAPGFPDCVDLIVIDCDAGECEGTGEEDLPLAPPDVQPSATGEYTITIRFNETVQEDHLDEVGAMILGFDPDAEYYIQESFPPTGVANFTAETEDVCLALTQELEQASFVRLVSCGPRLEPGDGDPNEPVVNDLE